MNSANQRYECWCCGYRTLPMPPPGSMNICPVCFWEDTPIGGTYWGGSNEVDIWSGQTTFLTKGCCGSQWSEDVRPPTSEEARDADWLPLAERQARRRDEVLKLLFNAFGHLRRGNGMRIYDAEVADDYGETDLSRPLRNVMYQRYDEISDATLAQFQSSLCFFDPEGFRFHLPAYLAWGLRQLVPGPEYSNDPSTAFFLLARPVEGKLEEHNREMHATLDRKQMQAVVACLRLFSWAVVVAPGDMVEAADYWTTRLAEGAELAVPGVEVMSPTPSDNTERRRSITGEYIRP